jgi:sugar lactone lactonase YvrE
VLDSGKVLAIDKTATVGIPSELASGQAGPSSIALDTDGVYWANAGDGTIARVAKAGGPIAIIAREQTTPTHLIADDAGLAWINAGRDVMGLLRHP